MSFWSFKKTSQKQSRGHGFYSYSVPLELLLTAIGLLVVAIIYVFRH